MSESIVSEDKKGDFSEKIGKEPYSPSHSEEDGLLDNNVPLSAVVDEIEDAEEMEVRGIMPLVRQRRSDRCSAAYAKSNSGAYACEVWKTDEYPSPHAHGFPEHIIGFAHLLEGLINDHIVEGLVAILGKTPVDIVMKDVQAFLYARKYGVVINLNTLRPHVLPFNQGRQKFTRAAAQVKDGSTRGDPFDDRFLIGPELEDMRGFHSYPIVMYSRR
jgi:hypothetical protein